MVRAAEAVDVPILAATRAQSKVYQFQAAEEDPRHATEPATIDDINAATATLSRQLATALRLAFTLGQRMGDVLNLHTGCLSTIGDAASGRTFLAIFFRQGKTTRITQPFRLHIPIDHPVALDLKALDVPGPPTPMFCSATDAESKLHALTAIKAALVKANPKLNILSVRRGGLQTMSLAGCSTETLLAYSRHRSLATLNRYMNWGETLLDPARERWKDKVTDFADGLNLMARAGGLTANIPSPGTADTIESDAE
jgi:hypothetical protein